MRILLTGTGRSLFFLARDFLSKGHGVVLIVRDENEARRLSRQLEKCVVVIGNGTRIATLEEAEAREADAFITLLPQDHDNLIACQVVRREFGVGRTIALINNPENDEVFRMLGVSVVVSATQIVSQLIEEQAIYDDIVNLLPLAGGRVTVTEILLPQGAPSDGAHLADLSLPDEALVACIWRGPHVIVPRGGSRLVGGDRLILISTPESYGAALRALTGKDR